MRHPTAYRRLFWLSLVLVTITTGIRAMPAWAGTQRTPLVTIAFDGADSVGIPGGSDTDSARTSTAMEIFLLLTVLSIAPALLIMLTAFTRIVMVLALLRQAMGTNQMPPNQVVVGLSLFLTFFVMMPVWNTINARAIQPYLNRSIERPAALEAALTPIREFMFRQTSEKDLALFVGIAKLKRPETPEDIPTGVLIPAFIISEVKTAFQIGLLLYVPFLIVDMVVASVLLSMGMMMLPPVMISLPFKLMLFVLADGWCLIIGSLVKSFS